MDRKKIDWQWIVLLAIPIVLIALLIPQIEDQYWDSKDYYTLATSFVGEDGTFAIKNFFDGSSELPGAWRGVTYALYLFAVDCVANLLGLSFSVLALIVNLALFSTTAALSIRLLESKQSTIKRRSPKALYVLVLGIVLLFALLVRYAFTTTLTDLTALCFVALGTVCVFRARESEKWRLVLGFVGGFFLYSAYNIRTIYMFSNFVFIAIGLYFAIRYKEKQWIFIFLAYAAGVLVAAAPQMYINFTWYHTISFKVFSRAPGSNEVSLFVSQLFWGIELQRYDTNVDLTGPCAASGIRFLWQGAQNLLQLQPEWTMASYFKLVVLHPFHFLALYLAHFLNLLSPYFQEVYITDLFAIKWPYLVGMYTICYIVIWDIYAKLQSKFYTFKSLLSEPFLFSLVLLFPVLGIIPGAIEHRFGLPLFFLLFYYFLSQCSLRQLLHRIKENPIGNGAMYLLMLGMMFQFWISTLNSGPIALPL